MEHIKSVELVNHQFTYTEVTYRNSMLQVPLPGWDSALESQDVPIGRPFEAELLQRPKWVVSDGPGTTN